MWGRAFVPVRAEQNSATIDHAEADALVCPVEHSSTNLQLAMWGRTFLSVRAEQSSARMIQPVEDPAH